MSQEMLQMLIEAAGQAGAAGADLVILYLVLEFLAGAMAPVTVVAVFWLVMRALRPVWAGVSLGSAVMSASNMYAPLTAGETATILRRLELGEQAERDGWKPSD